MRIVIALGGNARCGAQTQATIGLLLLNALDAALARRGSSARTAALVSRTRIAADDPGLTRPSKPIGRYLPRDEAQRMIAPASAGRTAASAAGVASSPLRSRWSAWTHLPTPRRPTPLG